jgi:hypothetical protein
MRAPGFSLAIFILCLASVAPAPAAQTNLAVIVRHAPNLNGNGLIEGSLQQLLGENVTLNGGFTMTGDLLVPGTPTLRVNGHPTYAGTIVGSGSASPSGYQITLNGNCSLNYLRTRTPPVSLPSVAAPPQPSGNRGVTINNPSQSIGNPATLRDLTLNGNVGQVVVPPGTYGNFTANGGSGFVFGVAGAAQPAIYNLQNLNLNGNTRLDIVGPVILTVANGFAANGMVGTTNHSSWLQLQIANGGFTLNGGCTVQGSVTTPAGTVIINGNSLLIGSAQCDRLTLNGGGCIKWGGAGAAANQPPAVTLASPAVVTWPSNLVILSGTVTDDGLPAGGILNGVWSQVSGPGAVSFLTPRMTNALTGVAITNQFLTAATCTVPGLYLARLTVDDGLGTNRADVTITVNQTPAVQAGADQAILWPSNQVVLNGTANDDGLPTGSTLAVNWSVVSGPGTVTFANAGALSTTATFSTNGAYVLELTASDGVSSNSSNVTITVDQAPTVTLATPAVITWPSNQVALNGTVVDDGLPVGSLLDEVWLQVSGPGTTSFGTPSQTNALTGGTISSQPATTAAFSAPGLYTVRLTAADGMGTNYADATVTVNRAPVVSIAADRQTLPISQSAVLTGTVTDDGLPVNQLTCTWSQVRGPGVATFSSAGATSTSVSFSQTGVYVLRLSASDSIATSSADIALEVLTNTPPVVSVTSPVSQSEFTVGQSIPVTVAAFDPDGQVVSVKIFADGIPLAELAAPPFNIAWTNAAPGDHVLTATATDDGGATAVSSNVLISVAEVESGDFVVEAGPDQIISLPNSASLAGAVEIQTPVAGGETNAIWSKLDGPGAVQFFDPNALITAAQFNEPGTYTLKLRVTYAGGTRSDTLVVDVLPPPPDRLRAARSSRGTDFWLTFLNNGGYLFEPPYFGLDLLISADVDTAGAVNFSDGCGEQRFQVRAGSTTTVSTYGWEGRLDISDSIQANAIHIIADHPVAVHGLNYIWCSTDGYLALPTAMLGTDYIVLSYRNSPAWYDTNVVSGGTEFAVVASEDDTRITITPSATVGSRIAGVPYQMVLQQGETYRLINYDDVDADLTGTTIMADKPIAVFGGHLCAYVPTGVGCADHLVEQLVPVNTWGRHFVTLPLAARLNGDTFRFLAATNGTRVAINGKIVASLNRGQFYEQIIDGPAEILASQPILVAQYANGSDYDGCLGDPFMMLVPSLEQFGGDGILSTPSHIWNYGDAQYEDIYTNYLNLVVRTNGMGLIQLDGVCVPASQFQVISNSGYAGAQLPVKPGPHQLSAPVPFGACVYGWAWYESYAFWSGVYSESIESDTRLELTQPTPFAAVGHEKTVMARVVNGRGRPIPDIELSFSAHGANTAAGRATTSSLGEAIFSYTGANAGADVITATLVDVEQSVTNIWIAGSDNVPPVVSTAGTRPLQFNRTIELVGTVTDDGRPAGASLNTLWCLLAGLGDVQIENATQFVTWAVCPEPGKYEFELTADDTQFSSHALVEVLVDDLPGLTGQEIPSLAPVGSPLELAANAWDDDGEIDRVEFYANDRLLGSATNGNLWTSYSFDWIPSTNGWFQIRAAAFDNLGGSNSLDLGLVQVDYPPQVLIDSPGSGAVLTVPTNVFVHATASDPDGTVVSLSIYANGDLLGTADGPEVTTIWVPRRQGDYTLTAVATDNLGLSTTSDGIPMTVTGDFPRVTIINNFTNQFGNANVRVAIGVPFELQADVQMTGPYHVTNVTFYTGFPGWGTPLGSVSEPPYRIQAAFQNDGWIYAVAEADSGAIGEGESWVTTYRDVSIAFAVPAAGKPVAVGMPVLIRLSVHDPGNIVVAFDYYVNGQLLVETTNSDAVLWQPSAPGTYELKACAIDPFWGANNPTCADPLSVTANFAFINNGVSIVSPADGDSLYVGSPVSIYLALEDPTGDFDHAEIFANGVSLGQTTNSCFVWVPQQTNDCSLTAIAYDHQGNHSAPSDPVRVYVLLPPPPQVVISSPKDGSRLALGQETIVAVDVTDPAQAVTNLALVVDGVKVADSLSADIPWTPNTTGSHALTVVAVDWNGNRVASAPVNVAVVVMHPPTVTVTSPTDGAHFTVETLPPLSAEASDSDGIVTNLVLELDGVVLGETNGPTLELSATNVLGGWHTVLARATDNDGLTTASTAVSFFIERSEDASLPVPAQLAARAVSATVIRLTWLPLPTSTPATSVLVERWNAGLSDWLEIGKVPVTETNYTDSNLNPQTCYRYRVATTDDKVHRSAYSAEARATTRTVAPNYSVIDLTAALSGWLDNRSPNANILTNSGLNHFDWRRTVPLDARHAQAVLGTNATALVYAVARFKEHWPHIQLDYDPILLSPKSILPRLGYLTGPAGAGVTVSDTTAQMFDPADPNRSVKAFLQEYQVLFGFGPEALTNATVQRDYVSAGNGARTVVWQQQVAGVPVFSALLIGHITQAGELACLSSEFIPSPAQAADPPLLAAVQSGADLPLPAPQALMTAVTNVGDLFAVSDVVAQTEAAGVTRQQTFTATNGIKGDARAELTWFPASRAQLRLCWQILFTSHWRNEMYLTLVAADTGEILYRRNLTSESSEATYRVYTNASPAPLLPGWSSPNSAQPSPMDRGLVTLAALDDTASPNGWINDGDNETRGNNVDAHLDRNDDDAADLPRPTGNPARVFDFALDLTAAPANYGEAAVVQLFYWNNWMHDALYRFGFTEAAGNFQMDNFGRGGLGNDAVQADAQNGLSLNDGRHFNNANMSVPPDGYPPRMQMFIFDGATPGRDGALDAEIVLHEYTHGLSSRLVSGGAGIDALQTAGLGEGWSDFYALALLAPQGRAGSPLPADDVDGVYPMGSYVAYHGFGTTFDENYYYGIRRYPYCTDTNKNPLTFADIDPRTATPHDGVPRNPLLGPFRADQAGEVHFQGEVWCMMLWEMRANLIRKLGAEAGNHLALQLVTDGLKLSPPNPNFVQARDAILLADRMWSGGANAAEIWNAFAKRGLGFNAKAPESYTTSGVQESHDLMPALATEQVEIQGANAIELGADNNLLIHVRNQGNAAATHVSGQLSTAVPGVTVSQGGSTYPDIPPGESRANDTAFQIRTETGFTEGAPIDLVFVITSDQSAGTNYLRLFTGVPGAKILFDNYSALADSGSASPAPKDLTLWDIGNAEPLWMADDASCLLKAGTGKYVLWKPDGALLPINNENFLAHRLTRNGVVVGALTLPVTHDELNNKITNSVGAWWCFLLDQPMWMTRNEYRWPRDAAPLSPAGVAYSLTNLVNGQPQFLTNVTSYPMLQDVWDQNSSGVAVGSVSVQEQFSWQKIFFDAGGTMNWFTPTERGLSAGSGTNSVTELRYYALLSSAAQFNTADDWRWLGPLSWGVSPAIALLVNDAGMIAGYGGVYTGDPAVDALQPTHTFRAPATGEFDGTDIKLIDLGVLPGGLHSFPRAMNQAGELAGYSDFDVTNTGGLTFDPLNSHAAFWGLTDQTPEYLTNLPPSAWAPYGFGDAYALNDSNQIVGASMTVDGRFVAVLWQLNHNTNGVSDTNSVPSATDAPYWEITDLNDRLTDPSWQAFNAVGINNDGVILAHAQNTAGEKHAVLLIPMAMAVDNNRDGEITFDDDDQTTADMPYRFWINDSHESSDEVLLAEDQIPGQSFFNANYSLIHVNGRSDLVNFFPVALRLGNVLRLLSPTNGYEYHLVQDDAGLPLSMGNGAVKFVYTSLTPANAFDYLTNTASFGYGTNFDAAVTNADTIQVLNAPGTALDTNFLAHIQNTGGTGIILVEGCAAATRPLWLEIWRNGKLLAGTPLYLSISGVEQMFRHVNFCAAANGSIEVPARADAPNEPSTNGKNFVFLHGCNVNQQEARGNLSEVFKRMYWSGSKAKFYGVTWNGAVTKEFLEIQALPPEDRFTPDYHTNVYNAFLTAPHLADFLGSLSGQTVVAAHSLGNMVVLSALNDCTNVNFKLNTYFMIDAAVAMEAVQSMPGDPAMVYSTWRPYSPRLFASDWWQLFPSDDGRNKLTWNNRFGNLRNTDIYNFYSSGEEVLRRYNVDPPAGVLRGLVTELVENWAGHPYGSYVWVWQEKGKGTSRLDNFIGSTHGGWKFSYYWRDPQGKPLSPDAMNDIPNSRLQEQPFFSVGSSANGPPDEDLLGDDGSAYAQANRNRILSDAIPALTLPVGANWVKKFAPQNVDDRNFDMQEEFENGWPSSRSTGVEAYYWHHSDFVYVAYPFTYKLFNQIATLGNLK